VKNRSVVFDTNGYRTLSERIIASGAWTIENLKTAECEQESKAFANPYVLMELASHLGDESDPHFLGCQSALIALYKHCQEPDGQVRLLADSESLIARMLYGRVPAGHDETAEILAQLAREMAIANGKPGPAFVQVCERIAERVESVEADFVADMRAVIELLNPECSGWDPFSNDMGKRKKALEVVKSEAMCLSIAGMFVLKTRSLLGVLQDDSNFDAMARFVLKTFPVSIRFYQEMLKRIVGTGCDISKKQRSNSIWDLQIAVGIGQRPQSGLPELVLVTGDAAITKAAKDACLSEYVKSVDEYLATLNSSAVISARA
jgi:hypothetical protein